VALESQSRDVTVESQKEKKELGVVQAANIQVMAGILRVCIVSKGNAATRRAFYLPYGKDDRSASLRSYDI
jgi:hypothetical protein